MEKITIINARNIEETPTLMPGGAVSEGVDLVLEVSDYDMVRDGYHTIQELYDHRIELYIALCQCKVEHWATLKLAGHGVPEAFKVWRSKLHSDGSSYEGWFIMGLDKGNGISITYHLPISYWDRTGFADTLEKAPEWDGHTSDDVLERLKKV